MGLGLAARGCWVLATGRVSAKTRAAFRTTREAGMYTLCAGVGIAFLSLGQFALESDSMPVAVSLVATAAALVFMGLAYLRYRPRKSRNVRG